MRTLQKARTTDILEPRLAWTVFIHCGLRVSRISYTVTTRTSYDRVAKEKMVKPRVYVLEGRLLFKFCAFSGDLIYPHSLCSIGLLIVSPNTHGKIDLQPAVLSYAIYLVP